MAGVLVMVGLVQSGTTRPDEMFEMQPEATANLVPPPLGLRSRNAARHGRAVRRDRRFRSSSHQRLSSSVPCPRIPGLPTAPRSSTARASARCSTWRPRCRTRSISRSASRTSPCPTRSRKRRSRRFGPTRTATASRKASPNCASGCNSGSTPSWDTPIAACSSRPARAARWCWPCWRWSIRATK